MADSIIELCRIALESEDVLAVAPRDDFAHLLNAYDAASAQLRADDERAWEALGKPEGTYSTTNVQRLCAEVERLRADMREAVELLGAFNFTIAPGTLGLHERRTALLAKHEETNQ